MAEALRQRRDDARRLALAGVDGLHRLLLLGATLVAVVLTLLGGLGLPLLDAVLTRTRALTDARRRQSGWDVRSPTLPAGRWPRVRTLAASVTTWRDLAWLATPVGLVLLVLAVDLALAALLGLAMPVVWALDGDGRITYQWVTISDIGMAFFAVPVGAFMAWLAVLAPRLFVAADDRWTGWLLAPTAATRMADRVEHLTVSRRAAIDSSAVELQRIERDLHDGAQARLVSLAMHLGMAEDLLDREPDTARTMLAQARTDADTAMADLRALVHGISPPLLVERGLAAALAEVASRSPVPVDYQATLERRLAPPVESAAYFVATELLTNAIRHSGASHIMLELADRGDALVLRVADDGHGGADPAAGSGLRGVQRRLAPFDGRLQVSSPPGGPSTILVDLPCASR